MPRGLENIATAFATSAERKVAIAIAAIVLTLFAAVVPIATQRLPEVPAYIPAIFSAASLAQILTAILFFVQWRITGLAQLAVLALAFGNGAMTGLTWLLAYPHVFTPTGLLGARSHTAGWIFVTEQFTFGALVIAYALLDRNPRPVSRGAMRLAGFAVVAAVVAALAVCLVGGDRLPATVIGRTFTPLWTRLLIPLLIGEYVVVLAVVGSTGVRTVAQVWMLVVCGCKLLEIVSSGVLTTERFAVAWYSARFEHLISSSLILYVLFVKISDLLVGLASRNRRLTERTEIDAAAIAEGEQRYRLLTNALPQLVWTTDPQGSIDYVNDRWLAFAGLDLDAVRNDGWLRAVHPDDRAALRHRWGAALRDGTPLAQEYRIREGSTGRYRWFLMNALAVREPHGTVRRWIATSTDIDVAKHIEERESFLAAVSERLAASIDIAATLATVKELAVPELCDWCQIDLIDDDGRFVVAAVAGVDGAEAELLAPLVGHPVEGSAQEALARIVARAEPLIVTSPDGSAAFLPAAGGRAVYERITAAAAFVVPLSSGESGIGTLSLGLRAERSVSLDALSLARDFGRRAALALEHSRLYERERATADALQRAMLPAHLPQLAHIRFSASYSAASESQRVGGDFYDAFELPDGRVALTIGDVTGHGLEAAVIMGEIRQALRAAAFERAEPSAILDRASRLLVASGRTVFVTAIFGLLDVQTGRFAYATAGHPSPLLFDGTRVMHLAGSGLPIGLRDDDGVDFALSLHAPCTLTLFTDGLIEFGRDLADGERRIEAAIRELAPTETDHLAAAIMKRVLGSDQPTDDIAILTATFDRFPAEPPGDEREWRFLSSDGGAAGVARREIGDLVARERPDQRFTAELAFGELIANAVRHAPGPVVARCRILAGGDATIELADSGTGFALAPYTLDVLSETGRGLELLRRLSRDVNVSRAATGGASVVVHLNGSSN